MAVRTGSVGPPIRANTFEPEVLRQIITGLAPLPGVVVASDLAVTQNGTPNMSVNVAAGNAIVQGTSVAVTQGSYWFYNDATVNLAVTAAHATLDRIDLVVAQIQDAFYAGASNTPQLAVIAGTPAGSPVRPAVPASSLILASLYITHAETSVLTAAITDARTTAGPRVSPGAAKVDALESTSSASYVALTTPGPIVSAVTGATALVLLQAAMGSNGQYSVACMSVAVSGATTIAAADGNAIFAKEPDTDVGVAGGTVSGMSVINGLTAGLNTFTAMYRWGGSQANFQYRRLVVIPL